jgi:hypothetical protein
LSIASKGYPKLFYLRASIFPKLTREVISTICLILGYNYDETVNEPILGMLDKTFPPSKSPPEKFSYVKYLSNAIHS